MASPAVTEPAAKKNVHRRIVQPVLPALPLINRKGKPNNGAGEGIKSTANGVAFSYHAQIPTAANEVELANGASLVSGIAETPSLVAKDGATVSLDRISQSTEVEVVQTPHTHQDETTTRGGPQNGSITEPYTDQTIHHTAETDIETKPENTVLAEAAENSSVEVEEKQTQEYSTNLLNWENDLGEDNHIPARPAANRDVVIESEGLEDQPMSMDVEKTPTTTVIDTIPPEDIRPNLIEQKIDGDAQGFPEVFVNGHARVSSAHQTNSHQTNGSISTPGPVLLSVYDHLLMLANTKQMADWAIQIHHPSRSMQPSIHWAHSLFLLRSSRIVAIMPQPGTQNYQSRLIDIFPPRPIQWHAFEAALRFIYSDTVLTAEALFSHDSSMTPQARLHQLDYLLSYWIAGAELGFEPITNRAFKLVADFVDWDVAEQTVQEVMNLRSTLIPPTEQKPVPEAIVIASTLLGFVFQLFAFRFDPCQFNLDTTAQPKLLTSRFAHLEAGRTASNPALASMVFGSMPSPAGSSPSIPEEQAFSIATVASLILLNMEFADLCSICGELVHRYKTDGLRIVNDVVNERERRRMAIISNPQVPNKQRLSNSAMWDITGLKEYVDQGNVVRERVSFLLPIHSR